MGKNDLAQLGTCGSQGPFQVVQRSRIPSMWRLIAVALVVAGVALPVCAQRGGGHGGSGGHSSGFTSRGGGFASYSGGFASRSTPMIRGSFPATERAGVMAAPQFGSRIAPHVTANLVQNPSALSSNRRPINPGRYPARRPNVPLYWRGASYGVALVPYPGYLGVPYDGTYDDSTYVSPAAMNYPAEDDYAQQAQQSEATQNNDYPPAYAPPPPSPEPEAESSVTLVFKDGRPVEQIHNYILTRTMLYVRDEPHRDIPVDQLDLDATEKMNHDADVNFKLPTGAR